MDVDSKAKQNKALVNMKWEGDKEEALKPSLNRLRMILNELTLYVIE